MKDRDVINLILDLLMFLALAFIAGIGFLMKYVLPPGRERVAKYGANLNLFLFGWDRHQWGTIHLVVAYILLGLLCLHIILHWNFIKAILKKAAPSLVVRRLGVAGICALGFLLMFFSFFIEPEKREGDSHHRNVHSSFFSGLGLGSESWKSETPRGRGDRREMAGDRDEEEKRSKAPQVGDDPDGHELLRGKTTLAEAAQLYGISSPEAKKRLGIPDEVSDSKTLGRLRKIHGFTMAQARALLEPNQYLEQGH